MPLRLVPDIQVLFSGITSRRGASYEVGASGLHSPVQTPMGTLLPCAVVYAR